MNDSKRCFVLGPPHNPDSNSGARVRNIREAISEAAKRCGYTAVEFEDMRSPGSISQQFIRCLWEDPLVIADLSGADPNVYYGLSVRHHAGKPVIQVIDVRDKAGWIVAQLTTEFIDPDKQLVAVEKLITAIQASERSKFPPDTPKRTRSRSCSTKSEGTATK